MPPYCEYDFLIQVEKNKDFFLPGFIAALFLTLKTESKLHAHQ